MSKTILITVIFAVLFLFGFAREMKLNAQQDSSSGNKKTCLDAADEYLRLNPERVSNKNELSKVLCFYDEVMRKNPSDLETVRRIRDAIVNYVKNSIMPITINMQTNSTRIVTSNQFQVRFWTTLQALI